MGFASSSAVRRDYAYGSLGGSFGGTGRKLKKKPVLVLDPEELAQAHHLFQIGAAEQLGEFDPRNRISVPAAAVFGMVLGVVKFDDEDDDYVALVDLADEEEEPEDELPPIDLDALLALTRAEQEEEDAFQRYQAEAALAAEAEEEPDAAEPVSLAEEPEVPEAVPARLAPVADASTADALARILSRAAAPLQQAPLLADLNLTELEPAITDAQLEPEEFLLEEPALADEPEPAHEPAAAFSDSSWPEFEASEEVYGSEDFERPQAELRVTQVIGEEGVRSTLRARLVREEISYVHPEPTAWRKLAAAVRRFWQRFS